MKTVLAFDVYGTLINAHGLLAELQEIMGEKARLFSDTWRNKQLEYSFRRGLMGQYQHFSVCTEQALHFTCEQLQISLNKNQRNDLLANYLKLPAFDDAVGLLSALTEDYTLVAFSNGEQQAVNSLLTHAGIKPFFDSVITADAVKTFKPDPVIYQYLLKSTECSASQTWLISGNPFDVIGANECGLNTVWVKRNPQAVFDPWGVNPTMEITELGQLAAALKNTR